MSDKYIVITTITHTRNTYTVNLDDIGDINLDLMSNEEVDLIGFADIGDNIYSSLLSEDVVAFAIKDYDSVVEHLETTESKDAADCFEEIESEYDQKF
jgi:hypothetical protein